MISILVFHTACLKELEGPSTSPPDSSIVSGPTGPTGPTGQEYGSLMIYAGEDFTPYCDSIPFYDKNTIWVGYLSEFWTIEPNCNDVGTLTIDSLLPGYNLITWFCSIALENLNILVVKDSCTVVELTDIK